MIRCGRCRDRHPTVAEVRACHEEPKRQRKGRQKRRVSRSRLSQPKPAVGTHYTRAGSSTAPEALALPPTGTDAPLNNLGTGRTRDLTMWERPEWERAALARLRQLDQEEY